ncbi:MAG TPA: carboxypeptidase-like regulatory domain-containing protein, partial [Bryobacteraceae bacterium]|nr:carboxypeptidase-like regulatory domain-containing protein [Bryobacteraceae bacterium]
SLDIWTSAGDCGVDFQVGETYLVYAREDEDSGKLETSVCMRTQRLSEEGGDLAFLYFLKNGGAASTRLEGFVSTSFADQNLPRYRDRVSAPLAGGLLELDGEGAARYARSDSDGRFVFDGLKEGNYRVSLLAPGYPRTPRSVIVSRGFHAAGDACVRQVLVDTAGGPSR